MQEDIAQLQQALDSLPLLMAVLAVVLMTAAVWGSVFFKWWHGQPAVSYQPRRQVPWNGLDVLMVIAIYFLSMQLTLLAVDYSGITFWEAKAAAGVGDEQDERVAHPIVRLLGTEPSVTMLVLCGLAAVVVAPLAEEFLFRLVLLGWLEKLERQLRRTIPALRSVVVGVVPVLTAALLFGLVHFRQTDTEAPAEQLRRGLFVVALGSLVTLVLATCWLRIRAGATWQDLGLVPRKVWSDLKLGLAGFAAILVPVYAVQIALILVFPEIFPKQIAPDPAPLFLLAILLGYLYYRTHRIVAAIVVHVCFNAFSLGMAWATLPK